MFLPSSAVPTKMLILGSKWSPGVKKLNGALELHDFRFCALKPCIFIPKLLSEPDKRLFTVPNFCKYLATQTFKGVSMELTIKYQTAYSLAVSRQKG